jgi:hypothetical protein
MGFGEGASKNGSLGCEGILGNGFPRAAHSGGARRNHRPYWKKRQMLVSLEMTQRDDKLQKSRR